MNENQGITLCGALAEAIGDMTNKTTRRIISVVALVLIGAALSADQPTVENRYLEPDYRAGFGKEFLWELIGFDGGKIVQGRFLSFAPVHTVPLKSIDFFAVRSWKNGLFGFVDRAGNWVEKARFWYATSITNGFGTVVVDGQHHAITDQFDLIEIPDTQVVGVDSSKGIFFAKVRPSTWRALTIHGEVVPYDIEVDGPSNFYPLGENLNWLITQDGITLYDDRGNDVTKHQYSVIYEPVFTGRGLLIPALIGQPDVTFYWGGGAGMSLDIDGEMVFMSYAQEVVKRLGGFVPAIGWSAGLGSGERLRVVINTQTRESKIFDLETLSFWDDGIVSASASIDGKVFCVFENEPRTIYLMDGENSVIDTFPIPSHMSEVDRLSLSNFGFFFDTAERRAYRIQAFEGDTADPIDNVRHFAYENGSVEAQVDDDFVLSISQLSGNYWPGLESKWDPSFGSYHTAPGTDRKIFEHLSTDASDIVSIRTEKGWSFTYRDSPDEVVFGRYFKGTIPFSNQMGAILTETGWQYIDETGATISDAFEFALPFSHGLAAVKQDGRWHYVDTEMSQAIRGPFDYAGPFHGDFAIVGLGISYPWRVNADPSRFSWYDEYKSIVLNGKLGVIDRQGELILPIEYDYLRFSRESQGVYIVAEKDGETHRTFLSPAESNPHRY